VTVAALMAAIMATGRRNPAAPEVEAVLTRSYGGEIEFDIKAASISFVLKTQNNTIKKNS
jgi:hypothetical protein